MTGMAPFKQRLRPTILVLVVFVVLGILGAVIYRTTGGSATPENPQQLQQSLKALFIQ